MALMKRPLFIGECIGRLTCHGETDYLVRSRGFFMYLAISSGVKLAGSESQVISIQTCSGKSGLGWCSERRREK